MTRNVNNYVEKLFLTFDPSTWRFALKPTGKISDLNLCVKELSAKEYRRLSNSGYHKDDLLTVKLTKLRRCFIDRCGIWVNGLCSKHPTIFVKEKRPLSDVYTTMETVPEFLRVSNSQIKGAGLGVFTCIDLQAGVAFGPYGGFLTTSQRAVRSFKTGGYAWTMHNDDLSTFYVDGKHPKLSNWMRYVNCARNETEQNLDSCMYRGRTYYYTYKPVGAGSELLTWYGPGYARILNIDVDEKEEPRQTAPASINANRSNN